ncbi:ATP-binding protein [Roseateles sp.]|uniref:sensor histidine kinase n=1 Tax=Roseateles sp. TaxID=1971397 RepID=UPI003BA44BF8
MIPKRFDSLFLRLVLAQVLLLAGFVLVFGGLLVVERNQLLAPHLAASLAPQIVQSFRSSSPIVLPAYGLISDLRLEAGPPEGLKLQVSDLPAPSHFILESVRHGLDADQVWISYDQGQIRLWVHARLAGDTSSFWTSGAATAALPRWAPRMTVGLVLMLLVIAWISRSFARNLTGPLAQLRARMQAHAESGHQQGDFLLSPQASKAPPELTAIAAAYQSLAERLQRNERERALLLAGVSHDLRSPLSRIRLAAEMLPESTDNADGVASITRNVDHADRLTASFLEFVRTSAVELSEEVDLVAAAKRAVAGFDRPATELALRAPEALLLSKAHGLLIERLIANLIDNAIKHGGVPVGVEIAMATENCALLIVSDAGPGLPPGGDGRLLEAFARGDASRNLPGFGLGLAIVQQTVLRLGGELSFAQVGRRHQVRARLPLRR